MRTEEIISLHRAMTTKVKAGNVNRRACVTVSMAKITPAISKTFRKPVYTGQVIRRERYVPPTC